MDEFKKAKDILEGVDKAEKLGKVDKEKKYDRKDRRDVSLKRSEDGDEKRGELLDSIVGKGRVCPSCKNRIWSDRSWVIDRRIAICRSCHYSKEGLVDDGKIKGGFIEEVIIRVEVDGWKILRLRSRSGVGIKAFADKMGYTKAYQYQIEGGGLRTMTLEVVEKMIRVFEDIGVIVIDNI